MRVKYKLQKYDILTDDGQELRRIEYVPSASPCTIAVSAQMSVTMMATAMTMTTVTTSRIQKKKIVSLIENKKTV